MPKPVVVRPATGRRINVHHVAARSIDYLLRGTRLPYTSLTIEPDDSVSLPGVRLAQVVDVLAEDRGRCTVLLVHRSDELCTGSCSGANPETVAECTCICGGVFHGAGGVGHWVPDTDDLIRIPGGQSVRHLLVCRGETFYEVLAAALHRPELRSVR